MLVPSCEAKMIQAMEFHSNDNVLVIGTGSGYLVECISYLSNTVSSYEIDPVLFEFSKRNLDHYSQKNFSQLHNLTILEYHNSCT